MNPKEGREDSSSARRADGSETFFYRLVSSRLRSPAGRIPDQVGLIAHAKLSHELRAVRLDGAGADLESIGDLRVRLALGREAKHFSLPGRQGLVEVR
jgi:hypothetical protein